MADLTFITASAVLTLLGVLGLVLTVGTLWSRVGYDVAVLAAVWALVGMIGGLAGAFPSGFSLMVAATGMVISSGVVAVLAATALPRVTRMLLGVGFSLLIFVPLALVVFGGGGTWLYSESGSQDFAGALPMAIGGGAFFAVVAICTRHRVAPTRAFPIAGSILFAVSAVATAVGMELRVDELTPTIALNMIITPVVSMGFAALSERIRFGRNTSGGLGAGILTGVTSALASCAYLETVSAIILGIVAGVIAGSTFRATSASRRLAIPLLAGGASGLLFLGIFSLDVGYVYSGALTLLAHQILLVGLAVAYSALISLLLLVPVWKRMRSGEGAE